MAQDNSEVQADAHQVRDRIQQANTEMYTAWNAGDADAVASLYAEDATSVDLTSGVTLKGRDALRDSAAERIRAFTGLSIVNPLHLIDGHQSASRWIMSGTHSGDYMGLPATGRSIKVDGASFSEFDDRALITHVTVYVDVPAILRQLGLD